jgi:hypothetical protein
MANACETVFAQFKKMRNIHCGFYKKKKYHDQKKFIPQLAIDTEFYYRAFANPCTM